MKGLIRDSPRMQTQDIERILMPSTYVRLVAQEFDAPAVLVAGTGIAAESLASFPHPISVRQHLQCIRNMLPLRSRPDWHLQWGKRMAGHFHGAVSLAGLAAPTLGDGLDAFMRYMPARVPYLVWKGCHAGRSFRLEITPRVDLGPVRCMLTEVPLMVLHEYVRVMRHGPVSTARLELAYPPTDYRDCYARWFDCPVAFGCATSALVIPGAWRDIANVDFDAGSWQAALARCVAQSPVDDPADIVTHVRGLLTEAIAALVTPGLPTLVQVAARLRLSPRTVIRRLRAAGTTFQALLDDVRMACARELLAQPENRVGDVAARLGYSDQASFRKAFNRWYGMPPATFRGTLRARG